MYYQIYTAVLWLKYYSSGCDVVKQEIHTIISSQRRNQQNIDIQEIQKILEMEDAGTEMTSNPTTSLVKGKETASKSGKFTFISCEFAKIYQ